MSFFETPTGDVTLKAKVVIVGSGPGGTFTALTLAEAGIDVVLLEEGHPYRNVPLDMGVAVGRMYAEGGFRTTEGDPPLPVAGGKALGGSTIVNSALCFRTPPERVEEWNQESGGAFSDTAAFHALQADIETLLRVAETPDALLSGNDLAHREAARALGWREGNLRRNTPTCVGCGRCNQGCTTGGKNSMDRELLPRAAAAGARIVVGCRVEHLATGRVEGTVVDEQGEALGHLRVDADTIVLSAGSIGTPRLLLDSGLVDREGPVGGGLRVQPVVSVLGYFPDRPIFRPGSTQGHFSDQHADDDIIFEANPTFGSQFAAMPFYGASMHEHAGNGGHWTSTGALIRDRPSARVLPTSQGKARIVYESSEEDHRRLLKGLRLGASLWLEGIRAKHVVLGLFGSSLCRTMDEVDAKLAGLPLGRMVLYSSHPQASCGMGRATSPDGEVLGLPGVVVADASVLPSNVGRNPQISVMTVSRIVAERLAVRLGGTVRPLLPETVDQPG
ncbi:MAG: GMC family oxidoreductase [Alphaproteobacteria bacterium]|nr:GMC family oxidoreductase [Alphaproteobacteria bacterium]MCB9695258.1 GMC family oxidoreductase [Alphaproteobacteria bacterium]